MDSQPISEILPGLYRAVLDAVATLEAHDRRRDAAVIRADATRVYSRAWNADAARRLTALRVRADRIVESRRPSQRDVVLETVSRTGELERTTA